MRIIVNGASIQSPDETSEETTDFARTIQWLNEYLHGQGLVITRLVADGRDVDVGGAVVSHRQDQDIRELQVTAAAPEALVQEGLVDAVDYLPRLAKGLKDVVNLFQGSRDGEAINLFLEALSGLQWFQYLVQGLLKYGPLPEAMAGLADKFAAYNRQLTELLAGWENRDYVLIADVLSYEIIPFIEDFALNLPVAGSGVNA